MVLFRTFDPKGNLTDSPDIGENAAQLKEIYEQATGRSLVPTDPESIILSIAAYVYTVTQLSVDAAGKQNLEPSGKLLDLFVKPFGLTRLQGSPSRVTLEFSGPDGVLIPQGVRVRTNDGRFIFETSEPVTIDGGSATVTASSQTLGEDTNGYSPGSISILIDVIAGVTVTSVDSSTGGTPPESDGQLRDRIPRTFDRLSPGTRSGYRAIALGFDPSIIDVAAVGPFERTSLGEPERLGEVDLYILTSEGIPPAALLDDLESSLYEESSDRIVGDLVSVLSPDVVPIEFSVELSVSPSVPLSSILSEVQSNLTDLTESWMATLGASIVVSRIIQSVMSVSGVSDVSVSFSVGSEGTLKPYEWGDIVFSVTVV